MKPGPSELPPGLYESLITEGLERRLSTLDDRLLERVAIHRAEAPSRFALHLGRLIENVIAAVPDADRVEVGMVVARTISHLRVATATIEGQSLGEQQDGIIQSW